MNKLDVRKFIVRNSIAFIVLLIMNLAIFFKYDQQFFLGEDLSQTY